MRIVCTKKALPRHLPVTNDLHSAWDIKMPRRSRLYLKLALFKTRKGMRLYWNKYLDGDIGPDTFGIVSSLSTKIADYRKGKHGQERTEVDPRYFAVMGISLPDCDAEVICHESVHAGFAWAKRVKPGKLWALKNEENEEEFVCYPAGYIARRVATLIAKECK